jgi:hypothetical protein
MTVGHPVRESETLASIRKLLLATLALGVIGTGGELVLLGHFEMPAQWIPIVVLSAAVIVLAWHLRAPGPASVTTIKVLMAIFVAAGALGVVLHYNGNVEFERELNPGERGFVFLRKTLAGATPVLAPGSMTLLGLIGLAYTYRHPYAAVPSGQERDV